MFEFIQSPLSKAVITPTMYDTSANRSHNQRYSSLDQCYSKPQSSSSSSRLSFSKIDNKHQTGQKTERENKQRAHSQKKLTLTSAIAPNGPFVSSLGQSQNLSLINARQAYEGFKKNIQLKTTINKNTQLQKKCILTGTQKTGQQIKFPTSSSQIRIESTTTIGEKQNEYEGTTPYVHMQKQKTRALIETNINNYYGSNPQYYCKPETIQTAPSSPVYRTHNKGLNLESKQIQACQVQGNDNKSSYQDLVSFFNEKLAQLKDQTNAFLMQNSKKIKELESLLFQNKQQLEFKDQKIRQLELSLVLKQNNPLKMSFNTLPISANQNNQFLISRISDLQKKLQVLSRWSNQHQQKINQKLDQINKFMDGFVAVKFHNLKFTLKAFVTKIQHKINGTIENVSRLDSIVQLNHLQSYQNIIQKAKSFSLIIQKLTQAKCNQKVHFEDMRTTINTTVDSFKHRPRNSTYQNMIQSTQINESFWNHLEDVSVQQSKMQQESSFTDDSFSYAPGLKNFQISSNNSSSVNQFALGSFPSFSKFSGETNICNESLHSIKSSISEQDSMCIKTLQEIAKYRQGPVSVYLDMNGSLRYKGSESYIFDRKGNILKPSRDEVSYCLEKKLISVASR